MLRNAKMPYQASSLQTNTYTPSISTENLVQRSFKLEKLTFIKALRHSVYPFLRALSVGTDAALDGYHKCPQIESNK